MNDDDTRPTGDATASSGTYLVRGTAEAADAQRDFQPTWATKDELPKIAPIAGLTMQSVTGGKLMANWVTIEPHRVVPRHQHPHEQLGIMLDGALEMTIGDETHLLRAGDAYTIPPNFPHSARTLAEGCVVLDIFTPPREDYR